MSLKKCAFPWLKLSTGAWVLRRVGPHTNNDLQKCFQFFITCKRTNNVNNATHYVTLGKKRCKTSKRNHYIISPRVIIKAIIIINRNGSRSQTSAFDERGLDDARTYKRSMTKCQDSTHGQRRFCLFSWWSFPSSLCPSGIRLKLPYNPRYLQFLSFFFLSWVLKPQLNQVEPKRLSDHCPPQWYLWWWTC